MMHYLRVSEPLVQRPATRGSLVDVAYDAIVEAIFNRRLEPGARLRIEALASDLGMSITPVREALTRTTAAGLTRLDVNRGHTVTPILDPASFHQLFAARRTIESAAVRGSERAPAAWVSQLSSEDIRSLRAHVTEMSKIGHGARYADYSRFSRLDHEFHLRLVQLGGNPFFDTAFASLNFHLHMSRLYAGAGVVDYEDAQAEHAAIVDALERHDGSSVWRACKSHMLQAEKRLLPLLRLAVAIDQTKRSRPHDRDRRADPDRT